MEEIFEPEDLTFPGESEIKAAQKVCCGCDCKMCESPVEYAWRKRRVELALLVERAIENELTEREKSVIHDRFYENMTVTEIAEKNGISHQGVRKVLLNAERKIKEKLEYAVYYIHDSEKRELVPLKIREAMVISLACQGIDGFSNQLKNARIRQGISPGQFSKITGISQKRVEKFENGEAEPKSDEIKKICAFYMAESGRYPAVEIMQ